MTPGGRGHSLSGVDEHLSRLKPPDHPDRPLTCDRSRRRSGVARLGQLADALAGATGLEPATFSVTGRRSNQLSYAPFEGVVRA